MARLLPRPVGSLPARNGTERNGCWWASPSPARNTPPGRDTPRCHDTAHLEGDWLPPARRAPILANPHCQGFGIERSPLGSEVQDTLGRLGRKGRDGIQGPQPSARFFLPIPTLGVRSPPMHTVFLNRMPKSTHAVWCYHFRRWCMHHPVFPCQHQQQQGAWRALGTRDSVPSVLGWGSLSVVWAP